MSPSNSPAADKRLNPGDVIVEIAQEAVQNADDFQTKVEPLRKEKRPSALLLVAGADGELRFVALSLQSIWFGQSGTRGFARAPAIGVVPRPFSRVRPP